MSLAARVERQMQTIEVHHEAIGDLCATIRKLHPPKRCAKKRVNNSIRTGDGFKGCETCELVERWELTQRQETSASERERDV